MESKEFANIRYILGKSQKQLAKILCVSVKTLQSFEQGWRKIPVYIEREMLLLLSLKRNGGQINIDMQPCWEVTDCPQEWREKCITWELRTTYFCWYLNGTYCQGEYKQTWEEKISLCRQCKVFQSLFPASI